MSDLISRETAVAILRAKADMAIGEVKDAASFFDYCANMLEKLPGKNAESARTGSWMWDIGFENENERDDFDVKCSACGALVCAENHIEAEGIMNWNYCPICGAKMDGNERKDVFNEQVD